MPSLSFLRQLLFQPSGYNSSHLIGNPLLGATHPVSDMVYKTKSLL